MLLFVAFFFFHYLCLGSLFFTKNKDRRKVNGSKEQALSIFPVDFLKEIDTLSLTKSSAKYYLRITYKSQTGKLHLCKRSVVATLIKWSHLASLMAWQTDIMYLL